ncbi:phenylalanine--tRNA ligase subunit alpha [Candidatus Nomurabacteria bacterium]|nr:phenylalanine--tRNA ligase subunit alpha [Candidatus Nomurabacteria bacterium]
MAIVASGISLAFDIELRVIMDDVQSVRQHLLDKLKSLEEKKTILRAPELRDLYNKVKDQPEDKRAEFGQAINNLKKELEDLVGQSSDSNSVLSDIDVTAPMDINSPIPQLIPTENGTTHPITQETEKIAEIFYRMGFEVSESREIDDDYHMFTSLNFPENHPARDDYDTFITEEGLIAPAHTSTMQNRIISARKHLLEEGENIAVLAMDRVFRNEDLDARHEHTFTQHEGILVGKDITVGNLVATLKLFFTTYYEEDIEVKITPFYFPFTEPSFEFSLSCPFCSDGEDCRVCSGERWIEMLGCGMIHPNVLRMAGVDPIKYSGFAWGGGVERLVMIKHNIEDIRHFNSGKLKFLRQFK